jgi:hypothetical protein
MHREFSWIAFGLAMLLILDGCQVGSSPRPSNGSSIFLRNLASSLDNHDSELWVTRPDVYGARTGSDRMRGSWRGNWPLATSRQQ